jgi:hypothetical protein
MPRVRVVQRPTGLINGHEWPDVGEELDLSPEAADEMSKPSVYARNGWVEIVDVESKSDRAKTEKRPSAAKNVETRGA